MWIFSCRRGSAPQCLCTVQGSTSISLCEIPRDSMPPASEGFVFSQLSNEVTIFCLCLLVLGHHSRGSLHWSATPQALLPDECALTACLSLSLLTKPLGSRTSWPFLLLFIVFPSYKVIIHAPWRIHRKAQGKASGQLSNTVSSSNNQARGWWYQ